MEELEKMKEACVNTYDGDGFKYIPEMLAYFENLMLTGEDFE